MHPQNIGPALTSDSLITAMNAVKNKRTALAEGFLYEQTILMLAADPGVGKSTVLTQIAVELSSGVPVFGVYDVPKPLKVLYVHAERGIIEFLERVEVINKVIPINKNNLVVTSEYQVLNLLHEDHLKTFIYCAMRDCPGVEVIIIDPIYSMVSGGLSKDEPASAFTRGMNLLQKATHATLLYGHHTVKPTYENGVKVERDDPFYGSQWLKAHVSGSYYMKEADKGVTLTRKKDNYDILPHIIDLEYDPQTELCLVPHNKLSAEDRVKNFVKLRIIDQNSFSFKDIQESTQVCTRTLRWLLLHSSISTSIYVVSSSKNKNLYRAHTM